MKWISALLLLTALWPNTVVKGQLVPLPPPDSATRAVLRLTPNEQLNRTMACLQPTRSARTLIQVAYNQHLFSYLFTPTGYVTVLTRQHTEIRLPASLMLRRCWHLSGQTYTFVKGQWCHLNGAKRINGVQTVQLTTYPDVKAFVDQYPQTTSRLSRVEVSVETDLPLPDYWQLVELTLREDEPPSTAVPKSARQQQP